MAAERSAAAAPIRAQAAAAVPAAPRWGGGASAGPALAASPAGAAGPLGGPRLVARAALLADETTGQVLLQRAATVPRPMASTTKVMTALLALERLDQRRVVTIGAGPPAVGEESLGLKQGERLTVHQLLLGLLVKSANDAAVALAEAVDGSEAAFVRRMNRRAAALHLAATHYVTPYGLDRPGHATSARDLAALWEVAMRRADFRALVATGRAELPGPPRLRRFVTTDRLLGSYRWTVGGKTGFTNQAGRCLVASASRGGRRLVAVAMGSTDAFADVRALFDYGFSAFLRVRLAAAGQPVTAAAGEPAAWQTASEVDALLPLDRLGGVTLALGAASGPRPPAAWLRLAGARLAPLPLRAAPGAAPSGPPVTGPAPPAATAPSGTASGGTSPAAATATPPGTATGPPAGTATAPGGVPAAAGPAAAGAVLVAGGPVRPGPAPAATHPFALDPLLRRSA
jgi:D-alanyl-D-alanine carboxypeptidase (penicillin-binding protein 5/6)